MAKLILGLVLAIVLLVVGGVYLALWNPPAPSAPVVKVLSDGRFPK